MTTSTAFAAQIDSFPVQNIFINSSNTPRIRSSEKTETESTRGFTAWLASSEIVTSVRATQVPEGRVLPLDKFSVTFTLREAYKNSFVLLRGLLEFSRPREISVSSNSAEQTFQIVVSSDQVAAVTEYLDIIFGLLVREIRFKASLRAIIDFERTVRNEQVRLYGVLKASA